MAKKSQVLAIGCGGCGNKLLDTFLSLDRSRKYTGIFFNTNLDEMKGLKNYDKDRKSFYVPNAEGTGKDRNKAEQYIKDEAPKFAEMIQKFTNQTHIIMFTSANGGTGSKATTMLPRLIKKLCPDKTITVVATFPKLDESDTDFNNTLDFWEELKECRKRKEVDNVMIIDNNKKEDEEEVNLLAMKELDYSFTTAEGNLDSTDADRFHSARGYSVVLKLEEGGDSLKDAIDRAIKRSMFFIPSNLECDVMVGNVNIEDYSIAQIKSDIMAYDFNKFHKKSEGDSLLLLGGCEMPTEAIELVEESLEELDRRKSKRRRQEDVTIRRRNRSTETKKEEIPEISDKDLDDMLSDDSFWD